MVVSTMRVSGVLTVTVRLRRASCRSSLTEPNITMYWANLRGKRSQTPYAQGMIRKRTLALERS